MKTALVLAIVAMAGATAGATPDSAPPLDTEKAAAYGLLTQGFSDWLLDRAKTLGLGALFGSLVLMALYAVLRRRPRSSWLWGAAVLLAFEIVGVALGPVFIAPLFNKFTPVHDEEIRQSILTMAREKGIPADDVYETDTSRRSDRITAYVAGALGTTRVVMGDTSLKRCTPDEIRMMTTRLGATASATRWTGRPRTSRFKT